MVQHPDLPVRSRLAGLTVRGFRARAQARASALPRNTGRANSLFHRYGWRSSNETAGKGSRPDSPPAGNGEVGPNPAPHEWAGLSTSNAVSRTAWNKESTGLTLPGNGETIYPALSKKEVP